MLRAEALLGGLLALIFFIAIISRGFARLVSKNGSNTIRGKQMAPVVPGRGLFAHLIAYFGITYFDHTRSPWFTLLASHCHSTFSCDRWEKSFPPSSKTMVS